MTNNSRQTDPSGRGRPNALYMGDLELRMLAAVAFPLCEEGYREGIGRALADDEGNNDRWKEYDDAGMRAIQNLKRLVDDMHERQGLGSTEASHRVG